MPTNLPPEYFEVERRYKSARTNEDKISALEELMGTIPKHKGTDKLRADLRRRLSKLKSAAQTQKGAGKHESVYHIEKEGAGRVAIIGPPNSGKSALLASLTHASPQVSEYPYTTWTPTPGMMLYENIQIQLIDTPPLSREHIESELFDMIKTCDLMLLVLDLYADPNPAIENTLSILKDHRIAPNQLKHLYTEQDKMKFLPLTLLVNKYDIDEMEEDFIIFRELLKYDWEGIPFSAKTKRNFNMLGKALMRDLNIIRVYSKKPGKDPDLNQPFVLKKGSTVGDFASKVHKDFQEQLKNARIWGTGVYEGQMVAKDHQLQEGDIVELHM